MKHLRLLFILIALILVAGVVSAQEVDEVRFQMGWTHEYSVAGLYMAGANGHYAAEDLSVELIEGGYSDAGYIDPLETLLAGDAEFAYTGLFTLLQARAAGKPIVAIGTINQRSPYVLMSLPEQAVETPGDLVGKTVSVSGDSGRMSYDALLSTMDIDQSDVNTVLRTDFGVDPLVNGDVDVMGGWLINEGVTLQEMGIEPNYIVFADYGIDTYDLLIVTTEDMIATNPDVVERFWRATVRGHEDLIAEPEEAAEVTIGYAPDELVYEQQFNRINAFLPLIKPAGSEIGIISPEVFAYNHQMLVEAGVLAAPLDDLSSAYNLSFLEAIYGELE